MKAWWKSNWPLMVAALCVAMGITYVDRWVSRVIPRTYIYEPRIVGYEIRDSVPVLENQSWITYTLDDSHIPKDSTWHDYGNNESSIVVGTETTVDTVGWQYDTTYIYAYPPDSVRTEVK